MLKILSEIILDGKYSNLALRYALTAFKEEDKRLITHIVYGTLQNLDYLRYQYGLYLERPVAKDIQILLDFSTYQLLFMEKVPAYAAINEAVEIAKRLHGGRYAKLVNAVLRKVNTNGAVAIEKEEWEALAIETSHPLWIVNMWKKQYGETIARKLCYDNNKAPLNMARINHLLTTPEQLMDEGFTHFKDDCYTYDGSIATTQAYLEGRISIQDYASQCIAPFVNPQVNERILDTCAAPGTKSAHMAELLKGQGEIIAMDIHEHRVKLIEEGASRLHLSNIKVCVGDATDLKAVYGTQLFDKILVDAPCTGYGVMKRKSDIKVHLKPEDMDEIIKIQAAILDSAALVCAVGGEIIYSTCTLNKKENELQIAKFLKQHIEFEFVEDQTIFPFEHECDGFYMAKLRRVAVEG